VTVDNLCGSPSKTRYQSRLGPHECWAIFEGTQIGTAQAHTIDAERAALISVASAFDLTIH
jgi:hypothetical protein